MRILLTGAERPMGACLARGLAASHAVVPIGDAPMPDDDLGDTEAYRRVDLRDPEAVAAVMTAVDSVVHAQPHDAPAFDSDAARLEAVSRGTYVLVKAAADAGVGRLVVLSHVALFESYPDDYRVDADWLPRPQPEAAPLTPWMAELVCREIARAGRIEAVVLRMGVLDDPEGTSASDAVAAVDAALAREPRAGQRWAARHIVSGGRFDVPPRRRRG